MKAFNEARKIVERKKRKPFFVHYFERGYESDAVAISLGRKLVADKQHIEGDVNVNATTTVNYSPEYLAALKEYAMARGKEILAKGITQKQPG